MSFLIGKMLFCLLATLFLGLLLGWLVSRVFANQGIARCRQKLDAARSEQAALGERLRSLKLEFEVCEQKREALETQCYEQQQAVDHERYLSRRYKEMLEKERKKAIDERFSLERDLTQKEIRLGDLSSELQRTRLKAVREVNLLNARLRSRNPAETREIAGASDEELRALKAALADRERQLETVRQQLAEIEARDDESTQELRQSAEMYQHLQEVYSALKQEHDAFVERHRKLQREYESVNQEKNLLETQMIEFREKEAALDTGVESIRSQQAKLERELSKAREDLHRCHAEKEQTLARLKVQKAHCRSITEHFAELDKALADARAENARLARSAPR